MFLLLLLTNEREKQINGPLLLIWSTQHGAPDQLQVRYNAQSTVELCYDPLKGIYKIGDKKWGQSRRQFHNNITRPRSGYPKQDIDI